MIDLSKLNQDMWSAGGTAPVKKKQPWETTYSPGSKDFGYSPEQPPGGPGTGYSPEQPPGGPGTGYSPEQPPGGPGGWETPKFPGESGGNPNLSGIYGDTSGAKTGTGTVGPGVAGGTPGLSGTYGTGASAPGWLGSGAYAKWGTQDPQYDPNKDPNVPQDWWRSPALNPQGGLVYNDKYGWQDRSKVKQLYQGGTAFDQFGLTPQLGQDWQQYFDTAPGSQPGLDPLPEYANDGMGGVDFGAKGYQQFGPGRAAYIEDADPLPKGNDINFQDQPKEWNTASGVLRDFATTGAPVDAPNEWFQSSANAQNMAKSGMATDTSDAYQKAKLVAQTDTQDAIKQAAEQAGLGGTRWSSSMGRNAQDIAGRRMAELGSNFAQQSMSAQEAARGRQMQANDQLFGVGSGFAGLDTDARNRAMGAAGQLTGLGQSMTQYPMELANQSFNMGTAMGTQDQASLNRQYQDFLRTAPESNPWLQQAMAMAMGQGTQQQYTPGGGSQLLSGLGNILPLLGLI